MSGFRLCQYEVTVGEWKQFAEETGFRTTLEALNRKETWKNPDPGHWPDPPADNEPVVRVSWFDCLAYANWKSVKAGLKPCYSVDGLSDISRWPEKWNTPSGRPSIICDWKADGYRLPTEAEREFAARGGRKSAKYKYIGSNDPRETAWIFANSGGKLHPVGTRKPNELGLCDLSGNVEEWCWDWLGDYTNKAQTNPTGPSKGEFRVLRGGSMYGFEDSCRPASRSNQSPWWPTEIMGFRLTRSGI